MPSFSFRRLLALSLLCLTAALSSLYAQTITAAAVKGQEETASDGEGRYSVASCNRANPALRKK